MLRKREEHVGNKWVHRMCLATMIMLWRLVSELVAPADTLNFARLKVRISKNLAFSRFLKNGNQ